MRILSVAFPFAPVSRDATGGAEQVLAAIDAALVAAGHQSVVIACEGSNTAGRLATVPACKGEIGPEARSITHGAVRGAIAREIAGTDLVHLHGLDFAAYLPPPGRPVLATLHLPAAWYDPGVFTPARPHTWLHCVSDSQHASCPPSAALLPPIPNGVPVAELGLLRRRRCGFALVLGRIAPEKGQHLALRAARRAGAKLLIAGAAFAYPEHLAYLDQKVRPLLDRDRRWLGPVGFARKRRLLAAARCLLAPSLAAETSSLVAMEAAACGTPVIALRAGALPDIVRDGVTGFLVDDAEQMAEAIGRAATIGPENCRAHAAANFDQARMTGRYLDAYRTLLA